MTRRAAILMPSVEVSYSQRCKAAAIITVIRQNWSRKDVARMTGISTIYLTMIERKTTCSRNRERYLAPKHAILRALAWGKDNESDIKGKK